jgi:hypothetical protein
LQGARSVSAPAETSNASLGLRRDAEAESARRCGERATTEALFCLPLANSSRNCCGRGSLSCLRLGDVRARAGAHAELAVDARERGLHGMLGKEESGRHFAAAFGGAWWCISLRSGARRRTSHSPEAHDQAERVNRPRTRNEGVRGSNPRVGSSLPDAPFARPRGGRPTVWRRPPLRPSGQRPEPLPFSRFAASSSTAVRSTAAAARSTLERDSACTISRASSPMASAESTSCCAPPS